VLWVAVGICLFVIVAAAVALTMAAVLGVRGLKAMKAEMEGGLRELNTQTAEMEKRLEAFAARSDELKDTLDRLSESLRRVSVLLNATRDARDMAGTARDFVPKK